MAASSWGKVTVRTMSIIAALAAALVFPGLAQAAPASPTPIEVTQADRDDFRSALTGNPMMAQIRAEWPTEYLTFETSLLGDFKAGKLTLAQANQRTYDFVASLQGQVAPYFAQATDADLVAFGRERLAILELMRGVNLQACYEIGEGIGLSLATTQAIPEHLLDRLSGFAAWELRVAISGRRAQIRRQPPTAEEFASVFKAYEARGGPAEYLEAARDGRLGTTSLNTRCDGAIAFSKSVLDQPPALAARMLVAR